MLGKIWKVIKREIINLHHNESGDAETFTAIATLLAPAMASTTAPQEQASYMEDPEYQKIARDWAEKTGEEYPEFPLDLISGELDLYGTRLKEMFSGELAPAVQQYLGYKYNQAWQSALPYYADIGLGEGSLASQRIQLGTQQAIEGAYLGEQQIAKGMEFMPQYTAMMLSPYMMDVAKWGNISDLIQQNFPGVEPGGVSTPTTTTAPKTEWEKSQQKWWGPPQSAYRPANTY